MNRRKILTLLGLAKRAGKVVAGEELVIKAIQNKRCQLLFLAQDAAPNLSKKIMDKATTYELPVNQQFTAHELSDAIGTMRKVLAIADAGFAARLLELLDLLEK